jgi:LytS/YehU family sensor histidine kinase
MWALFTALIVIAHGLPLGAAAIASLRMIVPGAALGVGVYKFTWRFPWPHPFRVGFVGAHVVAAMAYAVAWFLLVGIIDSVVERRVVAADVPSASAFVLTGIWLYIVVAGVAYANRAAQRTAQLQAHAARMQLSELRAQLHPHFLFNALHTIAQLIPSDPRTATRAAELLGDTLRTALDEPHDLVPLERELALVEQYLAIERLRFGPRLAVNRAVDSAASNILVPSFAIQTLIENAVRHGAAPRVETTQLTISARTERDILLLDVADDGAGTDLAAIERGNGTGLRRLRERLRWLYGERANLSIVSAPGQGFHATLRLPIRADRKDD